MTYNSAAYREQGGKVIRFTSGACTVYESGACVLSAATTQIQSGASLHVDDGASLVIKDSATVNNTPYAILNMGKNQWWYMPGSAACPTFSASPGDLLWHANSASTALYVNLSDGTAGSRWLQVRLATGSQIPGAK